MRKQPDSGGGEEMIRKRGFTVAEFLVLVMFLSILAVVVPNVSGAGEEGKSAALASYLLGARSRIELYKVHHNGKLPAATGENCANFLRRMATKTNADGDPGTDCWSLHADVPGQSLQ